MPVEKEGFFKFKVLDLVDKYHNLKGLQLAKAKITTVNLLRDIFFY